jgi:hypothetical protein
MRAAIALLPLLARIPAEDALPKAAVPTYDAAGIAVRAFSGSPV